MKHYIWQDTARFMTQVFLHQQCFRNVAGLRVCFILLFCVAVYAKFPQVTGKDCCRGGSRIFLRYTLVKIFASQYQ